MTGVCDGSDILRLRKAYALMIAKRIMSNVGSARFYVVINHKPIKYLMPCCNEIIFETYVSLDEVLIINKNNIIQVLYQEENIEDNVNTKKLRKKENILY